MGRKKKGDPVNGWVILDKPLDITSTQCVGIVRRIFNAQKAGHAGTLDPLATGILPIALGEATKTVPYCQDSLKTYQFTVTWGQQTSTDDAEGDIIATSDIQPTKKEIENALPHFTGEIKQTPPAYSAIKIDGKRAYDLARANDKTIEKIYQKTRFVLIKSIILLEHSDNMATFEVTCGKGTYVRSLARDLAIKLGTVGHVSALRRTSCGGFDEKLAISLDKLKEIGDSATRDQVLKPVEAALDDILALPLKETEASDLRHGRVLNFVAKPDFARLQKAGLKNGDTAKALLNNDCIALVEINKAQIKPIRVFNLN